MRKQPPKNKTVRLSIDAHRKLHRWASKNKRDMASQASVMIEFLADAFPNCSLPVKVEK